MKSDITVTQLRVGQKLLENNLHMRNKDYNFQVIKWCAGGKIHPGFQTRVTRNQKLVHRIKANLRKFTTKIIR